MLYPTIDQLTKDEFNRYELALATAKCARIITDEYVEQKEAAQKASAGNKETERNLINMINKEYRDEKAVKNAISKIYDGTFKIVRVEETEETEAAEEQTIESEQND
ncbi:MAG: DNA-directed RNA polymerase subunit omega [Ruminococcaceae bacterium]|nr:DNA-directed RNA polymerase subunit omega [Oscillospiraceae bacterium]